jgi:hypothetical protein
MKKNKICQECGIEFDSHLPNEKFCTSNCKKNFNRKKYNDSPIDRNKKANAAWLIRDEKKQKLEHTLRNRKLNIGAKLDYGSTQEEKVQKRFTACRG